MAGKGTVPKATGRKAGAARKNHPAQVVRFEPGEQPELPEGYDWPQRTRDWWAMWAESPLSENFGVTDWDFLLDTALVHAEAWTGNASAMAELRLRVSKFGATPEDRARLSISFADANQRDRGQSDDDEGSKPKSSRERFSNVTNVDFKKSS